jgi:hypothetical protein
MERNRSLFWPLLLIAAGVVWLLVKSGNVPPANLWALTHIWPFLLIAAGVGIILRPYWKYTSILLDVIIIGGALLAILYAPQLGWESPSMLTTINFGEPFIGPGQRGSGNVVTETREVSGFQAIEVSYPAQVLVEQGSTESVKIEAEDNLTPGLKTQVRNGVLEISYQPATGRHVNPTKPVRISIVVKNLTHVDFSTAGELTVEKLNTDTLDLSLSGAGSVNLEGIQAKALRLNLSGAGSMTASGTADDLSLTISGFGDFKGADLHSQTANVNISGAGSSTLWVDKHLSAELSGAGSVSYYGKADADQRISGVGSVKNLGDK